MSSIKQSASSKSADVKSLDGIISRDIEFILIYLLAAILCGNFEKKLKNLVFRAIRSFDLIESSNTASLLLAELKSGETKNECIAKCTEEICEIRNLRNLERAVRIQ